MKFHLTKVCTLLVTMTIAGNLRKISALSCYECLPKSFTDTKCGEPYPMLAENLMECPRNESQVCAKGLFHTADTVTTIRSCMPNSRRTKECDARRYGGVSNIECFFCDEDGCNAAHRVTISPTSQYLIVVSIVILLAWFGIFDL